jgi:ABC-type molybdenum transport system ATPase subunit/photorepair protein PhrA
MTTTTDRPQPAVALPAAGPPPGPAIEVEHLVKRYGNHVAVHDVSFTVAPGEVFGILGPNGAGKTSARIFRAVSASACSWPSPWSVAPRWSSSTS